ncbi:head-tail connector protein [Belliella pelovolcani]|uniref:Phage gp6-like head-tail connector protein n=1 Tax=Belliella pelovolcani TaxID=529505 RepID=A0A1N7MR50_9BACT|nr:phage head-tail connector protein [Belliella pelovolcani]SIS88615.1 phage conserved hypothetical protein, phiE125 gp8 family [Belliella pelovolcani]
MIAKVVKKSNETLIQLEEAKQHLRILHNHEDIYIYSLLQVVTDTIENELDKDLVDTEYTLSIFENIKENEEIYFPNSPIYSIVDVKFFNGNNVIDSQEYNYINSDEYLKFTLLPSLYTSIQIVYKKGFESSNDLPSTIKQAGLILLTDLYQYRGSLIVGKSIVSLDKTLQRLLQPYKQIRFF